MLVLVERVSGGGGKVSGYQGRTLSGNFVGRGEEKIAITAASSQLSVA